MVGDVFNSPAFSAGALDRGPTSSHGWNIRNPAKALSERIGTALINSTWFVRQLQSMGSRVVVMHGRRHIDWIGDCGGVRIISAPSPVMEATNDKPTCFYIHTLAPGPDGRLGLLALERIEIAGHDPSTGYATSC